jgi:hypothetical protein
MERRGGRQASRYRQYPGNSALSKGVTICIDKAMYIVYSLLYWG